MLVKAHGYIPTMLAGVRLYSVFNRPFQIFCPQQIEEAQAACQKKCKKRGEDFELP